MLEIFNQLNKIGKDLGLSKKEIYSVFLLDDSRYPLFYKILLIIIFTFLTVFTIIIIFILGIEAFRHIYPAGGLYSTVKIEDFNGKNK